MNPTHSDPSAFAGHNGRGPASFADVLQAAANKREGLQPVKSARQQQWEADTSRLLAMEAKAKHHGPRCGCEACDFSREVSR